MSSSSTSSCFSEDERENYSAAMLSPPLSPPSSRHSSRCSSPQSPRRRRNRLLPPASAIGTTLQTTLEDLIQRDLLDSSVVVELANSDEAQQKLEDLLPIHFYSWRLKNLQASLVYLLLHVFVLLQQYSEVVGERGALEDYICQLKARVSELEEEKESAAAAGGSSSQEERRELLRLRRENLELRQENTKLHASQNEVSIHSALAGYAPHTL